MFCKADTACHWSFQSEPCCMCLHTAPSQGTPSVSSPFEVLDTHHSRERKDHQQQLYARCQCRNSLARTLRLRPWPCCNFEVQYRVSKQRESSWTVPKKEQRRQHDLLTVTVDDGSTHEKSPKVPLEFGALMRTGRAKWCQIKDAIAGSNEPNRTEPRYGAGRGREWSVLVGHER